ncbi:cobalamin biosynthesis protein [Angustibacter sp. McL0619]|uniref:cobalamin biosynthesis protein n=1 Tax=Angustibacter sp. McL0619 TaxID=3415676 RepID=UPI003CF3D8B3
MPRPARLSRQQRVAGDASLPRSSARRERALGLVLGALLDAVLGDPRRGHPVAGFGRAAGALEQLTWSDSRARGAAFTALGVGTPVAAAWAIERRTPPGWPRVALTALATWSVLGARSLVREGQVMSELLVDEDELGPARARLSHLAGRDPSGLDADELARASVESLAENTSDAVVAPLLWGAVAGLPGLIGYRAANTLDAMVGHRSTRYERFGWASARLDDLVNFVPARISALLAVLSGGRPRAAMIAWRRDAPAHPSPNAGPVEAAFAGSLGVRLGGTNVYGDRVEHRGRLGTGPSARPPDLLRAVRLCVRVDALAVVLAAALARVAGRRR